MTFYGDYKIQEDGIFSEWFQIENRFKEKRGIKRLIYGLNEDSKRALFFLANYGIFVDGFFLRNDENKNLKQIKILGKKVFFESDLNICENSYEIIDVYGDNISCLSNLNTEILFRCNYEEVVIYGAGYCGKKAADFLRKCHINIKYYIDRMSENICEIEGVRVLSIDEFKNNNTEIPIVIAIDDFSIVCEVKQLLESINQSLNVTFFCYSHYFAMFGNMLNCKAENGYRAYFRMCALKYIQEKLLPKKDVYLYGKRASDHYEIVRVLNTLGIAISGIATDVESECIRSDDINVVNAWEFLYRDEQEFVIWVSSYDVEDARHFMHKSGLSGSAFLYSQSAPMRFDRRYIFDSHLGYIDSRKNYRIRNCGNNDIALKIAIVGGSTSDYDLFCERSWPDWLLEIARLNNTNIECIASATAGNISSQELIRLMRDIILEKPDIVISYSGVNDDILSVPEHPFTHNYQKEILEKLVSINRDIDIFALGYASDIYVGEKNTDAASVWLGNERMMHAICKEFGIVFLGILQPCLYDKKPRSNKDVEMIECLFDDAEDMAKKCKEFRNALRKEIKNYNYLHDFTEIFDDCNEEVYFDSCHVFGEKNKLIAEKIFVCVQREVINI